jgi:hypothetical protein
VKSPDIRIKEKYPCKTTAAENIEIILDELNEPCGLNKSRKKYKRESYYMQNKE